MKTQIKILLNKLLRPFNLQIESLTKKRHEEHRLRQIQKNGIFSRSAFPVLELMQHAAYLSILQDLANYSDRFSSFTHSGANDVAYRFDNDYFTSPDAEVLYTIIRQYRPRRVVEVGCGNSTRLIRQAIKDGDLDTRLVSIDPAPRIDITGFSDQIIQRPVEDLDTKEVSSLLCANDILFIDSSHIARTGSDVVYLFLNVLPALRPGVLIHVHDIFLPYEYPQEWVVDHGYGFNEQYLLQALLSCGKAYSVIWPGHYLQKTLPDFAHYFTHINGGRAQSFWMVKS